jgi:hypothetical protein
MFKISWSLAVDFSMCSEWIMNCGMCSKWFANVAVDYNYCVFKINCKCSSWLRSASVQSEF